MGIQPQFHKKNLPVLVTTCSAPGTCTCRAGEHSAHWYNIAVPPLILQYKLKLCGAGFYNVTQSLHRMRKHEHDVEKATKLVVSNSKHTATAAKNLLSIGA